MKLGKWALCLCLLGSLFLQSHALAQASPASKGKASVFSFENTRLGGFYQDDKNGPLWLAADMLDGYPAFAQLLQQNQKDTSRGLQLASSWRAMPRPVQSYLGDPTPVHQYLTQKGVENPQPQLEQAYRVDLDGDGQEELLIVSQNMVPARSQGVSWQLDVPLFAKNPALPQNPQKGQHSVVMLHDANGWHLLTQYVALKDVEATWAAPRVHKILNFADLDGDGSMEILMAEYTAESVGYAVYHYTFIQDTNRDFITRSTLRQFFAVTPNEVAQFHISGRLIRPVSYEDAYGYQLQLENGIILDVAMGQNVLPEFAEATPNCLVEMDCTLAHWSDGKTSSYDYFYVPNSGKIVAPADILVGQEGPVAQTSSTLINTVEELAPGFKTCVSHSSSTLEMRECNANAIKYWQNRLDKELSHARMMCGQADRPDSCLERLNKSQEAWQNYVDMMAAYYEEVNGGSVGMLEQGYFRAEAIKAQVRILE